MVTRLLFRIAAEKNWQLRGSISVIVIARESQAWRQILAVDDADRSFPSRRAKLQSLLTERDANLEIVENRWCLLCGCCSRKKRNGDDTEQLLHFNLC